MTYLHINIRWYISEQ